MKNLIIAVAVILALGSALDSRVKAQAVTTATPFSVQATGTLANCPAATSGQTWYCLTSTGAYQSINGGAYTAIGGAAAAPTLSINGVSKTLPASFTLAATDTISAK